MGPSFFTSLLLFGGSPPPYASDRRKRLAGLGFYLYHLLHDARPLVQEYSYELPVDLVYPAPESSITPAASAILRPFSHPQRAHHLPGMY